MTTESIKTVLEKLEHLMYGHNYQVKLGIEVYDKCSNLAEFNACLKKTFPNSDPSQTTLIPCSINEFWEEINLGMDYRGDEVSGLSLDKEKEERLKHYQTLYKNFISQHLSKKAQIFSYFDEKGIPGYPVYWDYRFVVLTGEDNCLFIYGSSSD